MDTDVIRQEDGIDAIKEQCPHFWPAMRVSPIYRLIKPRSIGTSL